MTACSAPSPHGAVPSPRQLAWHEHEFYGFIHFTTNTFTGKEWGYGDESPSIFNPTALDPRQWARVARQAGMKGLILTCKHHDGFCLWPSPLTRHSVASAPWKNGKGNVVRELCDACASEGLRFGVYLSPWDRNHPEYARPAYVEYFRAQLRDLLTNYGTIFEVWFDGANGGDGYYGGKRETRTIDRATYYGWKNTWQLVRELQPDAIMFSDVGPDCRWVGNEEGWAPETCWGTLNTAGRYPGFGGPGYNSRTDLGVGHEGGSDWLPPEIDVSIRPGWFYHAAEDAKVKTVAKLLDLYYRSVGHGGNFLLNLPPDQRGLIHEIDCANLLGFRQALDAIFKTPLTAGVTVTASATRGGAAAFAPSQVLVAGRETYWATDDDVRTAWIELAFPRATEVNHLVVQEPIQLGQRIRGWKLEAAVRGTWTTVATGTTVGRKRIIRFDTVEAERLRFTVTDARACPLIACMTPYCAPILTSDPVLHRSRDGHVSIITVPGTKTRYTVDGSAPTSASPIYTAPIALPDGGTVRATVLASDNPGAHALAAASIVEATFGISKASWRIAGTNSEETSALDLRAANAIDENAATIWHTEYSKSTPSHPHEICIDLGETVRVGVVGYLPRQDGLRNAVVDGFELYLSKDGVSWGAAVAEGRFDNILNNPVEQRIRLKAPVEARFVRFVSRSAAEGSPSASAAEINVYRA